MLLTRTTSLLQTALLAAAPFGGQLTARRNAWAAMSTDAARARSRREAEAAVHLAALRRDAAPGLQDLEAR